MRGYPEYAYNHPLFTNDMRVYSDYKVSAFINGITQDQSIKKISTTWTRVGMTSSL